MSQIDRLTLKVFRKCRHAYKNLPRKFSIAYNGEVVTSAALVKRIIHTTEFSSHMFIRRPSFAN